MKRAFIGAVLALLGTLWGAGVIAAASQMLSDSWDPAVGRLMTTIVQHQLMLPFALSAVFLLLGLVIMAVEYFKE